MYCFILFLTNVLCMLYVPISISMTAQSEINLYYCYYYYHTEGYFVAS